MFLKPNVGYQPYSTKEQSDNIEEKSMKKAVTAALQEALEEIDTFVTYAVERENYPIAMEIVRQYEKDGSALRLFKEHYSALPDALEEPILGLYQLAYAQGVRCLLAATMTGRFFYLVSADEVIFAGSDVETLSDDVLRFTGREDRDIFAKELITLENYPKYWPRNKKGGAVCPACGVSEGDFHLLGCVVEVCPWCDGQLSKCNCRFEKLDVDELTTAAQIEEFADLLDTAGRVAFEKEQVLAFPGLSDGLDQGKDK